MSPELASKDKPASLTCPPSHMIIVQKVLRNSTDETKGTEFDESRPDTARSACNGKSECQLREPTSTSPTVVIYDCVPSNLRLNLLTRSRLTGKFDRNRRKNRQSRDFWHLSGEQLRPSERLERFPRIAKLPGLLRKRPQLPGEHQGGSASTSPLVRVHPVDRTDEFVDQSSQRLLAGAGREEALRDENASGQRGGERERCKRDWAHTRAEVCVRFRDARTARPSERLPRLLWM